MCSKKNEWQNHNRIKSTLVKQWRIVLVRFIFPGRIMEVGVVQSDKLRRKNWQALRTNYSKASYWESACEFLQAFYPRDWDMLAPLNQASIAWLREVLGVHTEMLLASEMELSKDSTQRLVDICRGEIHQNFAHPFTKPILRAYKPKDTF
ncbi:MAG: hypothetical protein CME16_00260 [Gemmatimonadetes bacterium]|nr:hypothetical protein [Gemmatimonadota bacterium]